MPLVDPAIEIDVSKVPDAGIRKTPIVTRVDPQISFQEALEADLPEEETDPESFGEYIENIEKVDGATYTVGTGSANTDRYVGTTLGSVNAIKLGRSIYDEIDKKIDEVANDPDAGASIANEVGVLADENIKNTIATLMQSNPDDIKYVYENLKKWRLEAGPGMFEKVTGDVLAGLVAIKSKEGDAVAQERILIQYGNSLMAKRMDESSLGDKVWDFTKTIILPGTTLAMGDFLEKFDPSVISTSINFAKELGSRVPDLNIRGSGFKAYEQVLANFWKLDTDQRLFLFDEIEAHVAEVAGSNVFVYASMMAPFTDRSNFSDLKLFYDIDTATLLGFGAVRASKLLKTVSNIRNSRKAVQILRDTGQHEKAAEIINQALLDPNVNRMKKVTGMDYGEVAASANALDVSRANPGQIQGVAAAAAERLEKEVAERVANVDRRFVESFDPAVTPRRYYFDEAAKMEAQRKALINNNDYTNFAEIVERTDDGFVMEVTRTSDKYFLPAILRPKKYDLTTRQASNRVLEIQMREAKEQAGAANDAVRDLGRTDYPNMKPLIDDATLKNERVAQIQAKIDDNNKVIAELTKPATVERVSVKYGFDEQGNFQATEIGRGVIPKLNSPEQVVGQLSSRQVGDATLAEFNQAKITQNLSLAGREVFRGLTPGSRKKVDQILQWGDEMERTFTPSELLGGVDTRLGRVQLDSAQEIASYFAARKYFDNLHRAENFLRRRNLELGGFKELTLKLKTSDGQSIKAFAKRETGSLPSDVRRIYDHQSGKVVDVNGQYVNMETRLASGEYKIVNFRQGVKIKSLDDQGQAFDEIIQYGVVRNESDLRAVSGKVLNYRNGYIPKVRPNVAYVVQRSVETLVNGVKKPRTQTVRFFDNAEDAQAWKLQQADSSDLRVLPDRQFRTETGDDFAGEFDNLNFGGLYTGERSDRTILQGLDGVEAQRTSSYKTMQMYADHVANRYSTNELKMNLIGQFQNTFGDYLVNPANWRSPIKAEFANDLKTAKAINAQRDFIEDIIRVPDSFQQSWTNLMRGIAETIGPKGYKGTSKWVMKMGTKDPVASLRSLTFHQYLGFFNPAQLLVQGFGAATAVAAYPLKAAKLLPKNLALRAVWWDRANPGVITKIAETAGMKPGELTDIVKEIERVGLFDSLKTTADYNASVNGISMTSDAMGRMANASLVFLREGEMTARGYGYLLARDLFLSSKPKNYKLTNADVDKVAKDSLKFTMNLNRANRAWWQKGILSIPTQFWQVSAKFTESMVGGSFGLGVRVWTPAEKGKILLGYLAMFGAGGIPFGESMVADAMNAYKQSTDDPRAMGNERINPFNNLPPELRVDDGTFARFIKGGLVQVMANWLTGGDPNLTSRVSIPAGVVESIEMYGKADNPTLKMLGGAALPGLARFTDAALGLVQIWAPGQDLDLTTEEYRQAVGEVAKIMSSTRNAEKALWWDRIGYITDKTGKRLFPDMENDEFNSLATWQALGFSPAKVGWTYDLEESVKEMDTKVKDRVDEAYKLTLRYAPSAEFVDSKKKRDAINIRMQLMIADLTSSEKEKFYKQLSQRVLDDKNKLAEIMLKAIQLEAEAGGLVTKGTVANPLLSQ